MDVFQVVRKVTCGGIAVVGFLGQTALDHPAECLWCLGPSFGERLRLIFDDGGESLRRTSSLESLMMFGWLRAEAACASR